VCCGEPDYSGKNNESRIKTKTYRWLDFYVKDVDKCIEFDGTYWHGEVGRGNRSRDDERDLDIITHHPKISILHISESDYNKNKDEVIQQCLDFLNE
jgi:very-short-patch-repair endonuclease